MFKKYYLSVISLGLFCTFLSIGFNLAQRKPIWNDEILTQTQAIDALPYGQLAWGIIKGEGNNHPLFYLMQKAVCDSLHYKFPKPWEGEYLFADPRSQFLMRIGSNVLMSLSLVIIFYFFAWYYSVWAGFYALVIALLSPMTWIYWVEARPYSLWFLLSVLQIVLILIIFRRGGLKVWPYRCLIAVHIALALTTIASVVQIGVAVLTLGYVLKERRWQSYMLFAALPLALNAFYHFQATSFPLAMPSSWSVLLAVHIPTDRIVFFVLYIAFLVWFSFKKRRPFISPGQADESRAYLVFLLVSLAATAVYLFSQQIIPVSHPHNVIKDRYFLYLTPVVIVATVLFSIDLVKFFEKDRWMTLNVVLVLSGLLVIRFLRLYLEIAHTNLTLNYLGEYW